MTKGQWQHLETCPKTPRTLFLLLLQARKGWDYRLGGWDWQRSLWVSQFGEELSPVMWASMPEEIPAR